MSGWPVLAVLALAWVMCRGLLQAAGAPPVAGRHIAIDGLRGYLALAVFLHHGAAWYFYLRGARWGAPPSQLYTHLGDTAVALFFMITAFLFTNKLIEARGRSVDWVRLYAGRVLRLAPLYGVFCLIVFAIVAWLSGGVLREPPAALLGHALAWLAFTVSGAPDVNQVSSTYLIAAGVTWSLPYEWLFYLALPALGLLWGVKLHWRSSWPLLLAAGGLLWSEVRWPRLVIFIGGIVAAELCRREGFRRWACTPAATAVCIASLVLTVTAFPTAYTPPAMLSLTVAFAILAGGNTLGGVLAHPVSRTLGEMAYSLYLLHGLLLFTAFRLVIGSAAARTLSPLQHWAVVLAVVPVLLLLCFTAFKWIEAPWMARTGALTRWLRASRLPMLALLRTRRP